MTYLAVDFGLKKIGVAISDGVLVSVLPVLTYAAEAEVLERLVRLVLENGVDQIVVGVAPPDKIGAKKFGEKLSGLTSVPVEYFEEILTKQINKGETATQGKKSPAKEDPVAAGKLLTNYLGHIHAS